MQDGTFVMTEAGLVPLEKSNGYWVAFEETTLDEILPGDTVGVWTDTKTNKVWVDKSMHVNDLTTALFFGKMYSQHAIFDILNKSEIRID